MLATIQREQVVIVEMQTLKNEIVISSPYIGRFSTKDILLRYFENLDIPSMLWLRVYKSHLFNKDSMPKFYTNNEDMFVLPCVLFEAESIFFINQPLHLYFTENEGGVMNAYSKISYDKHKLLEKRRNILRMPNFIREKIGCDIVDNSFSTFSYYRKKIILMFLFSQPLLAGCSEKMNVIQEECNFKSVNQICDFCKRNLQNSRIEKLIKIFGLRFTYELYRRILWRFK